MEIRKKYKTPWLEVDLFEDEDIICSSGIGDSGGSGDDGEGDDDW